MRRGRRAGIGASAPAFRTRTRAAQPTDVQRRSRPRLPSRRGRMVLRQAGNEFLVSGTACGDPHRLTRSTRHRPVLATPQRDRRSRSEPPRRARSRTGPAARHGSDRTPPPVASVGGCDRSRWDGTPGDPARSIRGHGPNGSSTAATTASSSTASASTWNGCGRRSAPEAVTGQSQNATGSAWHAGQTRPQGDSADAAKLKRAILVAVAEPRLHRPSLTTS